jgi:hypothetical protein
MQRSEARRKQRGDDLPRIDVDAFVEELISLVDAAYTEEVDTSDAQLRLRKELRHAVTIAFKV